MNLWKMLLDWKGWSVDISVPRRDKCVICVAPHTSNWDFILGLAAYKSLGRNANFLMKSFWFFWPLGILLRKFGGIPVVREKKNYSLTDYVIKMFETSNYMNLAVTPEGTRRGVEKWRTGFLYIAIGARVPVQFGVIDYKNRSIFIKEEFLPSGDTETDMQIVKEYFRPYRYAAKYPDKFKS